MYHPVKVHSLSGNQMRRLMKGEGVSIKHGGHHTIHLDKEQLKKFARATQKGKGMVLHMHPHQIAHHGGDVEGLFRDMGRYVQPLSDAAINRGIRELGSGLRRKRRLKGGDIWGDISGAFQPGGSAENFGRQVAHEAVYKGLPIAGSTLGGLAGAEFGPMGAMGGSYLGGIAGEKTANKLGQMYGVGFYDDLKHHGMKLAKHGAKHVVHKYAPQLAREAGSMAGAYFGNKALGSQLGEQAGKYGATHLSHLIGEGTMGGSKKKGMGIKHKRRGIKRRGGALFAA